MTTRRILIVDDDQDIVLGTKWRLKSAGYDTLEANDGEQAVAMAAAHQPDAVLMDVQMPRQDGLEALSELQRRVDTNHIPVIMLSASLVDQDEALEAGAHYFLPKPYAGKSLLSTLDSVMTPTDVTTVKGEVRMA